MLEAIIYKNGKLEILDQLLLPHKTQYEKITSVQAAWKAIKSMKVRGAPAIAIVAALSLACELEQKTFDSKMSLHAFVKEQMRYLETSRPTAVNLKCMSERLIQYSEKCMTSDEHSLAQMQKSLLHAFSTLLGEDIGINKAIGRYGGDYMFKECGGVPLTILTHCNTGSLATAGYGTALGVIRYLNEHKILKEAYCTETRPYNQGARLTAYELMQENIPATLICDSMVAALMKTKNISAVVVGADRVVANGDTANKIGTYQIAVCAKYHEVPFYVASPMSTIDFTLQDGSQIPIEERPWSEMVEVNNIKIAPEGVHCWNPAFDVTPAHLITGGIITERGVFPAHKLKENQDFLTKQ